MLGSECDLHGRILYECSIKTVFEEKNRVLEEMVTLIEDRFINNNNDLFRMRLSIDEGIQNAFSHGNQEDPEKLIFIVIFENEAGWGVVIRDEGKGFNLENVPDPTSPEGMKRESGRGLLIMKQYMDEITYFDGGRVLRLFKKTRT